MTRAFPGKWPLLVPASRRNPQHFHRLCTGLAPLRTSHPHVCAQTARKQSCRRLAGSSGSALAPALVRPGQRAVCEDPRHAGPTARPGGKDRRPQLPGSRRPQAGAMSSARPRPRRHRHDQRVSQPGTTTPAGSCRILCNLSAAADILVWAGAEPRYLCDAANSQS